MLREGTAHLTHTNMHHAHTGICACIPQKTQLARQNQAQRRDTAVALAAASARDVPPLDAIAARVKVWSKVCQESFNVHNLRCKAFAALAAAIAARMKGAEESMLNESCPACLLTMASLSRHQMHAMPIRALDCQGEARVQRRMSSGTSP